MATLSIDKRSVPSSDKLMEIEMTIHIDPDKVKFEKGQWDSEYECFSHGNENAEFINGWEYMSLDKEEQERWFLLERGYLLEEGYSDSSSWTCSLNNLVSD